MATRTPKKRRHLGRNYSSIPHTLRSRSGSDHRQQRMRTVTFNKLLQYAKEHEATVRDFNHHKSNGGVAMATTIDEIRTFKFRKGNGQRAKGGPRKTCSKCSTCLTCLENAQHGAR